MKTIIKKLAIGTMFCVSVFTVKAQQVNTLYFLENAPVRSYLNPSLQPLSSFYLGLPVLGYTQFELGNNSFTLSSLELSKQSLLNSIRPTTLFNADLKINLLDFGFRTKKAYWTFGLTEKMDAQLGLPKDLFNLLAYGTPDINGNNFDFSSFNFGASLYTEAALGYSRIINDKWTVGGKAKVLLGSGNISASFDEFSFSAGVDELKLKGNGAVKMSSPAVIEWGDSLLPQNVTFDPMDLTSPAGMGAGIDLGATFKPFENLTFAAAVTDLSFIRWKSNTNSVTFNTDYTYTGLPTVDGNSLDNGGPDFQEMVDSVLTGLENSFVSDKNTDAYTTWLSPKMNLSAEYGFWDNRLSVGLLSRTMFQRKATYEELTTAFNIRPVDWFNMSLSYSALNGRASNIGLGLGFRILWFNAFVAADYLPVRYKYLKDDGDDVYVNDMNISKVPLPEKTDRFNVAFGFNLVFGNKQDKDKDGVSNFRDKCPDTPKGVKVDKHGCPVDSDGDGIPDYLDDCPDTPAEAYGFTNERGCPLDSDGDGVPDYKDKCPDTPVEARGMVDSIGCPLDTDKDGIYDYMDKCPDTPEGVKVDSVGCPLDGDGDGVADYLDLCPDTPIEAKGMVDKNGCLLDSDDDGVYDYLDLCPNTPAEARGFVDKNGCPLDADDDGVPDYLDKCPNTPTEARGMVDAAGCPRDTDGDGVPDYLDNCPKLAGVASNHGCPELKKEIRTLFQKALQGIQFESGRATIKKSSNTILNQIAKVLTDNPNYLVEVQGHTDNVGNPENNQKLSEARANSVRDYLISKGIAEKRITAKGYGDTKPIASNKTWQGRAKNRRVEFMISFEEVTFE
ncbi:MAG: DUF5723 family protein [Paludibacter sp.]|nr:DUF5723 family protein [Paludibacter sp.]